MRVLNWSECLLFDLMSWRLRSCGLSTVDFTDSWNFMVTTVFCMVDLVVFWKPKATLLKFFSNSTRGLVLEKRSSFGIPTSGIFWINFASVLISGELLVSPELLASPLVCNISLFFFVFVPLCLVFVMGSVASQCNGRVFPLLLELQQTFRP